MLKPPPEILLTVDGHGWAGWTEADVVLTLEAASGAFRLGLTERWSGQDTARPIKPGAKCTIAIDGQAVITGYVDEVAPSYDAGSHTLTVAGRDAAGDLVDCSADAGEWHGRTLAQIAAAIAKPFGVQVIDQAGMAKPFEKFTIEAGETAWEAIERACRLRGVLCFSNGRGNIVLGTAGSAGAGGRLKRGGDDGNILSGSAPASWRDQYSVITVKGQHAGSDDLDPADSTHVSGKATDQTITRYRPLVVIAEDMVSGSSAADRAAWEQSVRAGRARRAEVTVQGWTDGSGALWRPNTLAGISDDWLGLSGSMLVASVRFSYGAGGTTTTLSLAPTGAFELKGQVSGGAS